MPKPNAGIWDGTEGAWLPLPAFRRTCRDFPRGSSNTDSTMSSITKRRTTNGHLTVFFVPRPPNSARAETKAGRAPLTPVDSSAALQPRRPRPQWSRGNQRGGYQHRTTNGHLRDLSGLTHCSHSALTRLKVHGLYTTRADSLAAQHKISYTHTIPSLHPALSTSLLHFTRPAPRPI